MKEKLRQSEIRDREIIFPSQSFEENSSQLNDSVISESPVVKHEEKENDFFIPKPVPKKKMTVGRERYYILRKCETLMEKVKSLSLENYENFQVSVFCIFVLKDIEGNYLKHEESGLTENEEIYKIISDSYDKKKPFYNKYRYSSFNF